MSRVTRNWPPIFLLATAYLAWAPCVLAQDADETARPSDRSLETEVNEDNYRRFMELRDDQVQKPNQPYAALAPPGNLEKLGRLPEASQKHLRNQLREVILENGKWTPEDAGTTYPYVASEAAGKDPALRQMEAEAWSELVENYHAREAEIYQAGERGRSATADAGERTNSGAPGARGGPERRSESITGSAAGSAGTDSEPGAERQAGVTQNALQYLTGNPGPTRQATQSGDLATAGQPADGAADPVASAQPQAASPAAQGETGEPAEAQADSSSASTAANEAAASSAASDQAADSASQASAQASNAADAETAANDSQASDPKARQEVIYVSPGVIAIKDLDKLKGVSGDEEEPPAQDDDGP